MGFDREVKCLAIMPVGPRSRISFVLDSVAAFKCFMPPEEAMLVVLDDTRSPELGACIRSDGNIRVVSADSGDTDVGKAYNIRGILFVKQMRALSAISKEVSWHCLLRIDDDALMIGPAPHRDALRYFEQHPDIGMLGAYMRRGDGSCKKEALAKQGRRILRQMFSRSALLHHPRMVAYLVRMVTAAKARGYTLGHMCTGGAFFLSRSAFEAIHDRWVVNPNVLAGSVLSDDLLYAMHVGVSGLRFADFSDADQILAINWNGLPMPPEELVRLRKKIVHPVKSRIDPSEELRTREFFALRRAEYAGQSRALAEDRSIE